MKVRDFAVLKTKACLFTSYLYIKYMYHEIIFFQNLLVCYEVGQQDKWQVRQRVRDLRYLVLRLL